MDDDIDQWTTDLAFQTSHRHTFVNGAPDAERKEWLERMLTRAKAIGIACVPISIEHSGSPGYQFGFADSEDRDLFRAMVLADLDAPPSGRDRYSHDYSFSEMPPEHTAAVRLAAQAQLDALGIPYRMRTHRNGFTTHFEHFADRWLFENMAGRRVFEDSARDLLRTQSPDNDRWPGLG